MKELELYIHIPFCVKKCAYCDFLSFPMGEQEQESYVTALIREIKSYSQLGCEYRVPTIFLGGGTPSVLSGNQTRRIMEAIYDTFQVQQDAEITTEANPGTVDFEKLTEYKRSKINRISFGLQSVNNQELKMLGRIHSYEEFLESYEYARKAGFDNINVDLISAIPGQTERSWMNTLQTVIQLKPEHISAYSLIVEEGTPFYDMELSLPSEEEERRIYERTGTCLKAAGYGQYEISNYAKMNRECRHNIGYWSRKNYLGLGLGASSMIENVRFRNISDIREYVRYFEMSRITPITVDRIIDGRLPHEFSEVEILSRQAQMEEYMFLGLRMTKGVSVQKFQEIFKEDMEILYKDVLEKLLREQLLKKDGDFYRFTKRGIDVSNTALCEFLL